MSALPSVPENDQQPDGVRAPDVFDLHECSERIYGVLNFLKERQDLVRPKDARFAIYNAVDHLEEAADKIGEALKLQQG